ncbi:MAG: PilZ domain-containing protein [Burkholderiales bacterium]
MMTSADRCTAGPVPDLPRELKTGTLINLRLLSRGMERRIAARVLPVEAPDSILVTLEDTAAPVTLNEDDALYARCILGHVALGFTTRVLWSSWHPFTSYRLRYPERVDGVELRRSERVGVTLPARIANCVGGVLDAEVRDLSVTGVLLHIGLPVLDVGDELTLTFDLAVEGVRRRLDIVCAVRNAGLSPGEATILPGCLYGIQFLEPDAADRPFLEAYVQDRLRCGVTPFTA